MKTKTRIQNVSKTFQIGHANIEPKLYIYIWG
jgi:hypothetical protein